MVDSVAYRGSDEDPRDTKPQPIGKCMGSPSEKDILTVTSPRLSQADSRRWGDGSLKSKRNLRPLKSSDKFSDTSDEKSKPFTDSERREWKGWVELESDPTLFSYILRSYGVKDVKVQEVFTLDYLSELPKPVYGLIFLFKYRDGDAEEAEGLPKCPKDVWFANQTNDNACATVALLNIVMNAPQIELGETLTAFKKSTQQLKPAYRGQQLSCDGFIRSIHNSFARRMDILNADLAFSNEHEKWTQGKAAAPGLTKLNSTRGKSTKASRLTKASLKRMRDDDEAGYHFVAYVPVGNTVWRLDGLQRQPINIGETRGTWIDIARDNILQRIAQYEGDGIEYSLMALCRSPLHAIRENLAQNLKALSTVDQKLQEFLSTRPDNVELDNLSPPADLLESFGLSQNMIDQAVPEESVTQVLLRGESGQTLLLDQRQSLVEKQNQLKVSYAHEVAELEHENRVAESRKHDYTSIIYESFKYLASENELKGIVLDVQRK